jgi:hypothetical protein
MKQNLKKSSKCLFIFVCSIKNLPLVVPLTGDGAAKMFEAVQSLNKYLDHLYLKCNTSLNLPMRFLTERGVEAESVVEKMSLEPPPGGLRTLKRTRAKIYFCVVIE